MSDSPLFQTMPITAECLPAHQSSSDNDPGKLKQACSELESLFIYYLIKEMRATVPKSGLIGGGSAEENYTSMLDLQLSKDIAEKRGIGISTALFERLYHQVEKSNKDD